LAQLLANVNTTLENLGPFEAYLPLILLENDSSKKQKKVFLLLAAKREK
jgi:hypothetical protein